VLHDATYTQSSKGSCNSGAILDVIDLTEDPSPLMHLSARSAQDSSPSKTIRSKECSKFSDNASQIQLVQSANSSGAMPDTAPLVRENFIDLTDDSPPSTASKRKSCSPSNTTTRQAPPSSNSHPIDLSGESSDTPIVDLTADDEPEEFITDLTGED
jgi:hypothetical protein